jgi:UDP-N-acetylmuramoyl-tripeptide--D-alanyl-D-alanine ligase
MAELNPGGTLIINGDDERLVAEIGRSARKDVKTIKCGFGPECSVRAVKIKNLGSDGMEFEVEGWGKVRVPTLGQHSVKNALLALAVGWSIGSTFRLMCERLEGFESPSMRMNCLRLNSLMVLNDCYNSNPASAGAALQTLKEMPATGRRVAVLGDMLELGEKSPEFHRELGERASFVDWLLVTGRWSDEVVGAAVDAGLKSGLASSFADKDELVSALLKGLRPGDVILVKGSRGIGLEYVTRKLQEEFSEGDRSLPV